MQVRLFCSLGASVPGASVNVFTAAEKPVTMPFTTCTPDFSDTDVLEIAAPASEGDHNWLVQFPRQEVDGIVYDECTVAIAFRAVAPRPGVEVWDVPIAVERGKSFTVKVGHRRLPDGAPLEAVIRDESGIELARAVGTALLPGTQALYWSSVKLTAPAAEGVCRWSAAIAGAGAETRFSFTVMPPPTNVLTVSVVSADDTRPVEGAVVCVDAVRGTTNAAGEAALSVPSGTRNLAVWKSGYKPLADTITTGTGDLALTLHLVPEEPEEERVWM